MEILTNDWQVMPRLQQLALTHEGLMAVLHQCVAGYAGCTDNDPPGARGYETWRMGIRGFREQFGGKVGWEKNEAGGFPTIANPKLMIRIAVTNADDVTGKVEGDLAPQNRLPKGTTAERATATNQLIGQMPLALIGGVMNTHSADTTDGYQTWHFCVFIKGDEVRAELSRFNGCKDGFLSDCQERIFVVGEGEWTAPDIGDIDDSGPEFDFEIQRK